MVRVQLLLIASSSIALGSEEEASAMTCGDVKDFYKQESCCGQPEKELSYFVVPGPGIKLNGTNRCEGSKPPWANKNCTQDFLIQALEQAGADVSDPNWGTFPSSVSLENISNHGMIQTAYYKNGLCPVNVHWHLGAEHRSQGQYDESGSGPGHAGTPSEALPVADPGPPVRRLATDPPRYGYACKHYDEDDAKFTTDYNWQHCLDMHVGETYEVHWPHSTLGACGTPDQYQTPFYDGVFCGAPGNTLSDANATGNTTSGNVGVQAQVFTIVNDEHYYYPDLMRGMIVDGSHGENIAIYTGSTTGTSRDNEVCSSFAPITWQVDRNCHLISASSFDKMCSEMKQQRDDMSTDLHAHGSRELVWQNMSADNMMHSGYTVPR